MMVVESCRSRADSTLATTAGRSDAPASGHRTSSFAQVVKSTTADFSTSRPSSS
jgi:hypothetical protein